MEEIKLVRPSIAYAAQIAAYRREFLDAGDSMDGCGPLRQLSEPLEWLAETERMARPETVPRGLVPATQFIAVRAPDDRLVGMLNIRHYFNEYLEKFAGHIGYSVRPSQRRKGYAGEMLRLALPHCKELGIDRVLVTCKDDNEGSRRAILKNGGVFEGVIREPNRKITLERYWIGL